MWFHVKAYLKFLFRSFHLHGVHSPFVFQLTQNCFHGKRKQFLARLTDYLNVKSLLLVGDFTNTEIEEFGKKVEKTFFINDFPELKSFINENNSKFDMLLFQGISTENLFEIVVKSFPLAKNNSVFIIDKIHSSKEREAIWNKIIQTKEVQVSIDSFHFGLIFFRKEQAKEDFVVRI